MRLQVLALLAAALALGCVRGERRQVVYLTNWAQYRGGCSTRPRDFNPQLATHINYAFVFMNEDLSPKLLEWNDVELIAELQALKKRNSKLKTLVSMGGWTMNLPERGYAHLFSKAVKSKSSRAQFISAAMKFCAQYGFDGFDIDWEYPGDLTRGGQPTDRDNFAALIEEFRAAISASGKPFLLTAALGVGPQVQPGYDLARLHPNFDFLSLMTYDFYGFPWANFTNYNTPWHKSAVNKWPGIHDSLAYFVWQQGVPAQKLNLGLALYGRSWTLKDPRVNGLNVPTDVPGRPGPCTGEPGYIGYGEIMQLAAQGGSVIKSSRRQRAAYLVAGDQWVGFDTRQTLGWKLKGVEEWGLGGVMVWEGSLDDAQFTLLKQIRRWRVKA